MLIIAHRGASGYAPENTMPAFILAYEQNADGIEMDVHLTKDGRVVICHDDTLERTSNGTGELRAKTLYELKKLDFGSWYGEKFKNERIATFDEFWDWFITTRRDFIVNIEIKNGPYIHEGIEKKLLDIINDKPLPNLFDRIIISCFHHDTLNKVKQIESRFQTAPLFEGTIIDIEKLCEQAGHSEYIHPYYNSIDTAMLQKSQNSNIKINTWTVNTTEQLEYVKQFNINGIITNYPDRARLVMRGDKSLKHEATI